MKSQHKHAQMHTHTHTHLHTHIYTHTFTHTQTVVYGPEVKKVKLHPIAYHTCIPIHTCTETVTGKNW